MLLTVGGYLSEVERTHGEIPVRTISPHTAQPLMPNRVTHH